MASSTKTETEDVHGSKILIRRPLLSRKPLSGRYDPRELLNRWEREGKLKMTPGFHYRLLETYEPDEVEEKFYFAVSELAGPGTESHYLRWLPRERLSFHLVHLTEMLKPIVGQREPDFLSSDTVLFPFGQSDIVSLKRRQKSLFLDAKAHDRENWRAGTLIVSRMPQQR